MSNTLIDNENYQKYIEFINERGVVVDGDLATYPSGLKFSIPTKSMAHYHSTTQQDIIPLSIRANSIEDIFNLFLQELITGGQGLIEKNERENRNVPNTFGELFKELNDFHRIKGDDNLQQNLSLWLSENFNVITDNKMRESIKELFNEKIRYEEMDRNQRFELFQKLEINILEPSHLLFVKAYPSKNAQRYGKMMFSLLAESTDSIVDTSLLEKIRGYFTDEQNLDFETRLILDFLKSKVELVPESFVEYKALHIRPFSPSHAFLIQEDLKALFVLEEKLQRSYFIKLLYQILSMHLITYILRVLKALRYWVKDTRKQLQDKTNYNLFEIGEFRGNNYNLQNCKFSPSIKLYCGSASSLKTTDPIFLEFQKDLDLVQASGMDFVFIEIVRFLLKEAKKVPKNEIPELSDFLDAYNHDPNFKEYVEFSTGLMASFYLDWMTDIKNRKKSKYPHGNSNYWKLLISNFWADIKNNEISNFDVLLSLIEKHNATRKNDRETSFSWKMAYLRQFKEAGSIIQEISRGNKKAIGYIATDDFIILTVHLNAVQNRGNITLEQYEEYLRSRGIIIADNKKDSDENRVYLKKRLKDLGMFETVSDSKEAQFINTLYL
jgi:hypothetical protein